MKDISTNKEILVNDNEYGEDLNTFLTEYTFIPANFEVAEDGSLNMIVPDRKGEESTMEIAETLYVITKRLIELSEKKTGKELTEAWTISWVQDGIVVSITRNKDYILGNMDKLSFPINHNRMKENKEYLYQFKKCNPSIELNHTSSKLGWRKDGFLLANTYIKKDGTETDDIIFDDTKPGMSAIVKSMQSKGSFNRWEKLIKETKDYPLAFIGVYVSFASVLISLFENTESFFFEWAGLTSTGKTTSQKLAASVWGKPTTEIGGFYQTWNITDVGAEMLASTLNHVPLFLDDTKQATNEKMVADAVYRLAGNRGKGRGKSDNGIVGLGDVTSWKNITLSTGESKMTSFGKSGGTAARALIISDSPFARNSLKIVNKVNREVNRSYGVAGKEFIKFISRNQKECLEKWEDELYDLRDEYEGKETSEVLVRLSKHMAFIELTAKLVHECFDWKWDYKTIVDSAWNAIKKDNQEADRPKQAFEFVTNYAARFRNRFISELNGPAPDNGDCFGEWFDIKGTQRLLEDDSFELDKDRYIRFYTSKLIEIMVREGFNDTDSIIKEWKNRGYLGKTEPNKTTNRITRKGVRTRVYELDSRALENRDIQG